MEKHIFMIQPGRNIWMWFLFTLLFVVLAGSLVLLGYIFYSAGRATFRLETEGLHISGSLYGRTIDWDKLKLDQAKIVDLSQEPDLQLTARTNGSAMGDYREGWFRMRNGGKALVFLTKSKRIIYLPITEDYTLMLSPQQAEEMLQTMQANQTGETYLMEPVSDNLLGGSAGMSTLVVGLVEVGILVLFAHFAYSTQRTRFEISWQGLRIRGNIYGRKIPLDVLKIDEAKMVDMKEQREYGTRWRTNGIGMPGYKAGWFRLRKKEKALLFVTNLREVVHLPTRKGYSILLSPQNPEEFLRVLTSL